MDESPAGKLLKSAYEVARDERLKQNRKKLEELGFLKIPEISILNTSVKISTDKIEHEGQKQVKVRHEPRERQHPTRHSKRIQGLNPEGGLLEIADKSLKNLKNENEEEEEENTDENSYMKIKIERLKALHEERHTGYKNPTATYDHTWMRIRTMSDKALGRRINVIENALVSY